MVLLLWIICVIYALCLLYFGVCSLLPCGHLRERADLLDLVCEAYCDFDTFPFVVLVRVWCLMVSSSDPCCLSYFETTPNTKIPKTAFLLPHSFKLKAIKS